MDDRRQYFRIDDRLSLSYRVVQTGDAEDEINKARRGYAELAELRNALFVIDARMDDICNEIKRDFPLIAELTTLINKKIALHERLIGIDEPYDDNPMGAARDVNLSANGVAFEAEIPMVEGSHLKIEMVMYPENYYIPLYGRVISCRKSNEEKTAGYKIAVEFEAISEKDRERVMHHILSKQAEDIKKQRGGEQQPGNNTEELSTGQP